MDIAQDGNLFPREDILEAVAQSDWRDQPVRPWAWILAAVGVFFVSLGWPIVDPLTASTVIHSAAHPLNVLHPLHAMCAWLGPVTGLGIEFTWYVLSSLCLALTLPALGLAIRSLGIGARLAFSMALLGVLSPELFAHGRLPSDFPAGVLGAAILLALTLAPSDPGASGARGFGLRVAAALVFATILHPWSLVAAPAVCLAAWRRGALRAALPVLVAALSMACALFAWGSSRGTTSAFAGNTVILLSAVGSFLAVLPIAWVHAEEESPPPAWMTLWLVSAIVGTVASMLVARGLSTLPMLLPILALFAAGALARLARPDNAFRLASLMVALQIFILTLTRWAGPVNVAPGLCSAGAGIFERGDIVYVPPGEAGAKVAYLARRRFNAEVIEGELAAPIANGGANDTRRHIGVGSNAAWTPFTLDFREGKVTRRE